MAVNPISPALPADLPTTWINLQTIAANGSDVGLATQYGYNYLMAAVNAAQAGVNALGAAFPSLATNADLDTVNASITQNTAKIATLWDAVFTEITGNPFAIVFTSLDGVTVTAGVYNQSLARLECTGVTVNAVATHNATATTHQNLFVDGNASAATSSTETLEEHMVDPYAHQNLFIDGNNI